MSVTGIALVLFLTFHASMNVVALISAKGYNMICEFLGANWYAVVATVGLAALVCLHFVYALWLTWQNRKARGADRYAITDKPAKVEWASQNMLVLGIIVILGMVLHLWNFWYNMMWAELTGVENEIAATDGVGYIIRTFSCPVFTSLYIVWLAALWFHLNHGFWSAIQTLGWNGKVWFDRWRCISLAYSTLIIAMFAAVAIMFACGWRPCDMKGECGQCPKAKQEQMAMPQCCKEKAPCCERQEPCCKPQPQPGQCPMKGEKPQPGQCPMGGKPGKPAPKCPMKK